MLALTQYCRTGHHQAATPAPCDGVVEPAPVRPHIRLQSHKCPTHQVGARCLQHCHHLVGLLALPHAAGVSRQQLLRLGCLQRSRFEGRPAAEGGAAQPRAKRSRAAAQGEHAAAAAAITCTTGAAVIVAPTCCGRWEV